jgi:adenylosuccinate synthase
VIKTGLEQALPVYEALEGWHEDISSIRDYEDLPINARI